MLQSNCSKIQPDNVPMKKFFKIINNFGITLTENEREIISNWIGWKEEGNQHYIKINPIINFSKIKSTNNKSKSTDKETNIDKEDPVKQQELISINEDELINILKVNYSMNNLWANAKRCDIEKNGIIQSDELNSLFIREYPDLNNKNLYSLFKPFMKDKSKNSINYRILKEYLEKKILNDLQSENIKQNTNEQSRNLNLKKYLSYINENKVKMARDSELSILK